MYKEPLVSVIMSVYNCGDYIEEALISMLTQSYMNLEIIIIDDGSDDRTCDLINRVAIVDPRIYFYQRERKGIASNLNDALVMAKGEFIARMDGDDISTPDRIARQVDFLIKNPEIDIVGCWLQLFGLRDEVWHYRAEDNFIKNSVLLFSNGVGHNSILVRASVYKQFRYDVDYTDVEDTELWTRMFTSHPEVRFANIREVLVLYRIHEHQSSIVRKARQRDLYRRIISKYLSRLGVSVIEQDMDAHEWMVDQPTNLSDEQLYRLADWLNFLSTHKTLPDDFGVLAERWHHLCRKNNVNMDVYTCYHAGFDICWLPKISI
ncbi:glycosyltransferase family 2 protein [Aeromonas allosaccharophila]|uniref:glycosyltransferase family 2 protein n=1 Tax=Aeromonas allosaccharophila TaxID=656 RepID=UPI000DCF97CB|nr:glycosyltransferase [Aeromonas allosaccharophila]